MRTGPAQQYVMFRTVQIPPDQDVLQMLLDAVKYTPPKSRWIESQRGLYTQLLSQARADILVAPVQVEGAAFDASERLLMTARLARYLEQSSGRRVADPFLVDRALGEGARRTDSGDIERLAVRLGATRIVLTFAGHDRAGRMNVSVRVLEMKHGEVDRMRRPVERRWSAMPFENDLPSDVFARLLPEIGGTIGMEGRTVAAAQRFPAIMPLLVPMSLDAIVRNPQERSPVVRAYHLQLIGALHPWYSEHARDRAFVRSLLMLDQVTPDSPDYRLLKSRALLHLQRRPFALKALGEPKTPEERALHAALNGNLPELDKAVAQINAPLNRLLAELELADLRARYKALDPKANQKQLATMVKDRPQWQALVTWKARDWDKWSQRSNLELKAMLDRSLPTPGPTAESLVRAQATLDEFDPRSAEMELSVYRHTRKLLTAQASDWCCQPAFAMPNRWDQLDLISELAETNLTGRIEFYLDTQGSPEQASELITRYESVYKDHPAFTSLRAWTDWRLAQRRGDPEREGLRQQGLDNALRALHWAQGQTWAAREAMGLKREQSFNGPGSQEADELPWLAMTDGYIGDWPIRWYWPTWEQGGNAQWIGRNRAEQLAYSTHSLAALTEAMHFADDAEKKRLLEQTANRFAGAPGRVALLGRQAQQQAGASGKKQVYLDAIRANPNAWEPYHTLGRLAIEAGDYAGALQTFQSYPGFSAKGERDEVALSQYAYEAGSDLYWRGAIDEAVPLYERSAGYDTGSHGSMASSLRLKLLKGDYRAAAQESLARAQRYDSAYAYRDFLSILHVLGYSKDAWPAFDALMEKFENPQVWASAYVGKRIAGAQDGEVERWLRAEPVKSASANGYRFAPNFAVLWYVVDRKPGPGFAMLVEQLDSPPQNFVAAGNPWTVRGDPVANPQGSGLPLVGPSGYKSQGRAKRAEGMILRSDLAYFAEAYTRLRADDFAGANRVFEEMAAHYEFAGTYATSYFARAAAKSGNGEAFEKYLDRAPPNDPVRFDYYLAKAFLAAAKSKHTEALTHLKAAFNVRPNTDARPIFTEYQFAEACEWLYRDSKEEAYRDLALDWVRKHQRIAPMYSWAYAMEAELAKTPAERQRALAITLYLDPNSERASRVPAAERAKAKQWLSANNPFLKPAAKRNQASRALHPA